jgi:hypothetical protein
MNSQRLSVFVIIGIALLAVGLSGQAVFAYIGFTLIVIGLVSLIRLRKS